jgi:hypothetical protein
MADVRPPDPHITSSTGGAGFAVLGVLVALPLCVVISLCGWIFLGSLPNQGVSCVHGFVPAIITVVAAGLLVWFAWHMLVRNRSNGRGPSFLRGFSVTLAAFLLVPWPCSLTWTGFGAAIACAH